jgi:hypothetical protein
MTPRSTIRVLEAAQKRYQREPKKRQRELERQTKEMARLSAQEQARLEVETYENEVEMLLSIHKEQTAPTDWFSVAAALPPPQPTRQAHNEFKARQRMAVAGIAKITGPSIEEAQRQDEREHQEALQAYAADREEWEKMSSLARRMLNGETDAYIVAIQELNPFAELAGVGSSIHFTVHTPRLIEIVLSTNGKKAIPAEHKTLTTSGKVSSKTMPKARFIEIYQDYVCGCILRVARELFALLPIDSLLITATVDALDSATGQTSERSFLSVAIPRTTLSGLNFDLLDPSDAILGMTHKGDLKASRKTGDFEFITPLTLSDISRHDVPSDALIPALVVETQQLLAELRKRCDALLPTAPKVSLEDGDAS